ncbi:MAG: hypothetical protein ACOYN8_06180 [Pseudanabaena sp.]
MKKLSVVIALIATFLTACASGLDGSTYTDSYGITSYTFKSGGKVTISVSNFGVETEAEMEYKVENGKVKIGSPQGTIVMNILEDGSIQGPMGIKFTKKVK